VKPPARVGVSIAMTRLSMLLLVMAGCGGTSTPPVTNTGSAPGPLQDTRSAIERRRDTACDVLKPRLVQCAVDDAKAELDAGRMTKPEFTKNTTPEVKAKLGVEWLKACRVEMSSRQVRVLEVCNTEEQQCGPLLSCLENLNPRAN
jgi:hypothetical protein